jgi:transposase-like protein
MEEQRSEEGMAVAVVGAVDPEVTEKPQRRRFSAEYKLRVLRMADACTKPGEIGALLRREGLFSSHLTGWRQQRDRGVFDAMAPKKRGRKRKPNDPLVRENAQLRREKAMLERKLRQAETIIEVQKKISEILGIPLKTPEPDESDS